MSKYLIKKYILAYHTRVGIVETLLFVKEL